jgi:hypothetical protein
MDDSVLEAEGPLDEFGLGSDYPEMELIPLGTNFVLSDSCSSTGADGGSPMEVDS